MNKSKAEIINLSMSYREGEDGRIDLIPFSEALIAKTLKEVGEWRVSPVMYSKDSILRTGDIYIPKEAWEDRFKSGTMPDKE